VIIGKELPPISVVFGKVVVPKLPTVPRVFVGSAVGSEAMLAAEYVVGRV
jgi:hypothetical protein